MEPFKPIKGQDAAMVCGPDGCSIAEHQKQSAKDKQDVKSNK